MIKEKELNESRPQIRFQHGQAVTLGGIQQKLAYVAKQNGVPMAFGHDYVKCGGLLGGGMDECLVVHHPAHSHDYFKYAVCVKHQGTYAFVSVRSFGNSKQLKKDALHESYKRDRAGKDLSYKLGSVIGQAFATIGRDTRKIQEEKNWYTMANDVFDEVLC